jgi:hypothetical protein
MTPDYPVSASYLADMVAYYCVWSNSARARPGIHLNSHGAETVSFWTRRGVVLKEAGLWESDLAHRFNLKEAAHHVHLLHDIFYNPFHPITLAIDWRFSSVQQLARVIYEDRAFDRLPILADALEEAGCTNPDILDHCRGPGPHVRGCWVVDLILGKE